MVQSRYPFPPDTNNATRQRWHALTDRLGAQQHIDTMYNFLLAEYQNPPRDYHSLEMHVSDLLNKLDDTRTHLIDKPAAEAFVWLHDSVYDPKSTLNIHNSKAFSEALLNSMAVPKKTITTITNHIEASSDHIPRTPDQEVLLDLDLSILGASPYQYNKYAEAIRNEYSHVDDATFRKGRRDVLTTFLNREPLYNTIEFRNVYEDSAKRNLARELEDINRALSASQ